MEVLFTEILKDNNPDKLDKLDKEVKKLYREWLIKRFEGILSRVEKEQGEYSRRG